VKEKRKMLKMKNYLAIIAVLLYAASASYASLIPLGAVPSNGAGLGAVTTVLTFTSPAAVQAKPVA
jgi:hypothetical protein